MEKKKAIDEVMELRGRVTQVIIPYAIKSWRDLRVPLAQLKSLFIIAGKGEINFRTLARDLGVTPGDVTRIVDRLVEQGLVSRRPSPEDRRSTWLQATQKGRELLSALMESQYRHTVHILEFMDIEDLRSLSRGLSGFIRAVEEHQRLSNSTAL